MLDKMSFPARDNKDRICVCDLCTRRLQSGVKPSSGPSPLSAGARQAGIAAKMKRPHPVSLPLRYQSLGKRHVAAAGTGLTVAIGNRMAIFVAQHRLVAGSQVELFIDWPAKLMEKTPLQLYMRGTVCGSEGERTLVAVRNHVFKIKPSSPPRQPISRTFRAPSRILNMTAKESRCSSVNT